MRRKDEHNKEKSGQKILKKIFKNNEIVIYAIALMLVTAGYFNYSANTERDILETSSNNIQNTVSLNGEKDNKESNVEVASETEESKKGIEENEEDIGDAKLVSNNIIEKDEPKEEENNKVNQKENNQKDEQSKEENVEKEENETKIKEEKKEKSNQDYFITSKLERDTNLADMISTYTKIIEDKSVSETQKAIAMKEITKINNNKNAISVCENLLSTKGFSNYLILVNNESINVVVEVEGGLKKEKVAQIQNIISREFGSKIENIHISEK